MDFTYGTTNCNMEVEAGVIDPQAPLCWVNPRLQGRSRSDLKRGLQIRSALRIFTIEDYKFEVHYEFLLWETTKRTTNLKVDVF